MEQSYGIYFQVATEKGIKVLHMRRVCGYLRIMISDYKKSCNKMLGRKITCKGAATIALSHEDVERLLEYLEL